MEDLVIDIENTVILEGKLPGIPRVASVLVVTLDLTAHLQCAGNEMPICKEDEKYFGPLMHEICEKKLLKDKDGWCVISNSFDDMQGLN
jgi:DEAD/DEAH box helicase domain-containing protein